MELKCFYKNAQNKLIEIQPYYVEEVDYIGFVSENWHNKFFVRIYGIGE